MRSQIPHLIARLHELTVHPRPLAIEIHRLWYSKRRDDGWTLGPPDHTKKTTPYLKPLGEFTEAELDRELSLAVNDVRGIAAAVNDTAAIEWLDRSLARPLDAASLLRQLALEPTVVEKAAVLIHEGWRRINTTFGRSASDERMAFSFYELPIDHKAITLANVRIDIEASINLLKTRAHSQ
jgi:hypothetical protein